MIQLHFEKDLITSYKLYVLTHLHFMHITNVQYFQIIGIAILLKIHGYFGNCLQWLVKVLSRKKLSFYFHICLGLKSVAVAEISNSTLFYWIVSEHHQHKLVLRPFFVNTLIIGAVGKDMTYNK